MDLESTKFEVAEPRPSSVPSLMVSIQRDLRKLLGLQADLARAEVREQGRRLALGILCMAIAIGTSVGTTVILGLNLVEALQALSLSRGVALALVSLLMLAVTVGLARTGLRLFTTVDLVPHQTLETLKENAEWITNPIRSETKSKL